MKPGELERRISGLGALARRARQQLEGLAARVAELRGMDEGRAATAPAGREGTSEVVVAQAKASGEPPRVEAWFK